MSRRRDDEVLTDYVRERLDQLMADGRTAPTPEETDLRTVLRPRPTLAGAEDGLTGLPSWWHGRERSSTEDSAAATDQPQDTGAGGWARRFTRQHLLVVGVVLAVGVLIAAFAMTRARAVPVDVTMPEAVATPTVAPTLQPEPAPTPELIRVHVVGEVANPGVHQLRLGARVADAIEAADGLTGEARPGELNLAQELIDGQQIIVGGANRASEVRGGAGGGAAGTAASSGPAAGKLNLNTATAAQLDALPGVGPVTAEKIVAWRTEHGRFTRTEELQEVPGIGPKTYAEIAPHVTV